MIPTAFQYISAGGNRHPSAADWHRRFGIVAYGTSNNVALWKPLGAERPGVFDILSGHTEDVSAVHFGSGVPGAERYLHTGSLDGDICIWRGKEGYASAGDWSLLFKRKAHIGGAVNAITSIPGTFYFVTAGADAQIRIWRITPLDTGIDLIHIIHIKPRYIPLTVAAGYFTARHPKDAAFLAIGGTRNSIQVYVISDLDAAKVTDSFQANLPGHEAWITSLALKGYEAEGNGTSGDVLLASASQDKSIRIWKISNMGQDLDVERREQNGFGSNISAKAYKIQAKSRTLAITFEALLLGHEDWIHKVSWNPRADSLQLLSASADNSLFIWEPEQSSGIWVSNTRLGEISAQKGSTSATGSTGGFWNGLWSPEADAVTCLGKTGSWRVWLYDEDRSYWIQKPGVTGHTKSVTDISWAGRGDYLLSTSSDQTTRLHAKWKMEESNSWHEVARPQIHGYDINCIHSLSNSVFVSGADEKLLRVFKMPRQVAQMLATMCDIRSDEKEDEMPEAANMPVLGLSNKAMDGEGLDEGDAVDDEVEAAASSSQATYTSVEPPSEDHLSKHTLWPEQEKLYGHGYEISAVAGDSERAVIATACKASSTDHAVIRLYDSNDWHEIRPPLLSHSLTIAKMHFQPETGHLLSVGRDRKWTVFQTSASHASPESTTRVPRQYTLESSDPKGHSRMILDAAWSPIAHANFFATASRDKTVRIWSLAAENGRDYVCRTTLARKAPVTALTLQAASDLDRVCLAVGEETGKISYHIVPVKAYNSPDIVDIKPLKSVEIDERLCPSRPITRLAWRPNGEVPSQLAVASSDSTIRILSIDWQATQE